MVSMTSTSAESHTQIRCASVSTLQRLVLAFLLSGVHLLAASRLKTWLNNVQWSCQVECRATGWRFTCFGQSTLRSYKGLNIGTERQHLKYFSVLSKSVYLPTTASHMSTLCKKFVGNPDLNFYMWSCFPAVVKAKQHADGTLLGSCTLKYMVCASSVCPTAVFHIVVQGL